MILNLKQKIDLWLEYVGESFYDYFAHDNIDSREYGKFLISKGYVEYGENILAPTKKLFIRDIFYPNPLRNSNKNYIYENVDKNLDLLVEFLNLHNEYDSNLIEFFTVEDDDEFMETFNLLN